LSASANGVRNIGEDLGLVSGRKRHDSQIADKQTNQH
jgi:hypothetical protein